jgi:hypothetical protein
LIRAITDAVALRGNGSNDVGVAPVAADGTSLVEAVETEVRWLTVVVRVSKLL